MNFAVDRGGIAPVHTPDDVLLIGRRASARWRFAGRTEPNFPNCEQVVMQTTIAKVGADE